MKEQKDNMAAHAAAETRETTQTAANESAAHKHVHVNQVINLPTSGVIVPDTSVIVDGRITDLLKAKKLGKIKIIIHKATIGELEHQANVGKETGLSGLAEINAMREMSKKGEIDLEFAGDRSSELMIKGAKLGEIDNVIRELARLHEGMLITGDRVQSEVAKAEGIRVIYLEPKVTIKELSFKKYLTPETVSLHFKEDTVPMAKLGKPGHITLVPLRKERTERDELEDMVKEIIETAKSDSKSYFEADSRGASVIQLREFRIAIARQPFSDGVEITVVRPIMKASIDDYKLSAKLKERLKNGAEGVIICGAPGSGKSTFAAALAEMYLRANKIVKTMESPRDLQVPDEITQYAPLDGSFEKTGDILLLVRPDYSFYDEMRKTSDFKVFSDLRLSGIGMVGVVHATRPIESIQRFIGRIDLGMIPQVVDTVIFIKEGYIQKVMELRHSVKIPHGMRDRDLARPVVQVSDFETGKIEWELYKFGDETVSMKVENPRQEAPVYEHRPKRFNRRR
ncbi:putative KH and PIN-domain containing protein [uncultured archaeon]|nr:putative KH and PIN-domain containing protein [uncultured archaeon]